jgi:hypothetical protein
MGATTLGGATISGSGMDLVGLRCKFLPTMSFRAYVLTKVQSR